MIRKNNKKSFHEIVQWRVLCFMCVFMLCLYLYPAIAKEPTQIENEPAPWSFLRAIINDQMVSLAIARLQSPSEDGHAKEFQVITTFVKSQNNPYMQKELIAFLLKLINTDNTNKEGKELPPLITDKRTQIAVLQALAELAPQGKQVEDAIWYSKSYLLINAATLKQKVQKTLALIINNDKHQTKSTVGMLLNEIMVDDSKTLEELEFWINLSQTFNASQNKMLNQIIISKYVKFLVELRGNETTLSDQDRAMLFADIITALQKRVPPTTDETQIELVRDILRSFKTELPEKASEPVEVKPNTEALQVILNTYNSLHKGVKDYDKIKLEGFREAFVDIVWKSNQKESFLIEVINNMSDNSDSQRCDNDSAIFEVIKNKHHNELASLLVKILGSNTSVLIANNARWIVVNELELALKDTQDLKLKNRFKEILKNLVFTEQGDNNREHFAFLLSSKVECFSLNDNEKYDLWSKFLQVEKQSHFTSNDRLAAIIELTTITDAKLLSKVALLFWDVLFDNYNGKDNNEDVFHERTVLLTDLYELYGNAKIFNSSNVPYPTSPKAIFTLNHIFEDKNFNYSYVLAAVNIAFKIGADTTPAIPKLSEALKDEDEKVRESATKALVEIEGPVAIAVLIEALKDENYNVRGAAASILGSIQDPAAISALSGALKDSTWEVRYTAVKALGEIKDSAAVPVLTKALRDTNIDVRLAVAEALAKIEKAHPNSTTSKQKDSSNPETLQAGSAETTQEK